jgi:hypothetical protein
VLEKIFPVPASATAEPSSALQKQRKNNPLICPILGLYISEQQRPNNTPQIIEYRSFEVLLPEISDIGPS